MTRTWFGSLALGGMLAVTTTVVPTVAPKAKTIDASLTTTDGRSRTYHLYVPSTISAGSSGDTGSAAGGAARRARNRRAVRTELGLRRARGGEPVHRRLSRRSRRRSQRHGAANLERRCVLRPGDAPERRRRRLHPDAHRTAPFGIRRSTRPGCSPPVIRTVASSPTAWRVSSPTRSSPSASSRARSNSARCRPSHPVSVLHIHGTADHNLPINGGRGAQSLSGVVFRPPRDGAKTIAEADQCRRRSTSRDRANPDVTIETWRSCTDRTEVRFVTVAGRVARVDGRSDRGAPIGRRAVPEARLEPRDLEVPRRAPRTRLKAGGGGTRASRGMTTLPGVGEVVHTRCGMAGGGLPVMGRGDTR